MLRWNDHALYSNSTAALSIVSFRSMYLCVTARLRCPVSSASTLTFTPLWVRVVMSVLRPEWDVALSSPAALYYSRKRWQRSFAEKCRLLLLAISARSGSGAR